MLFRSLQVGTHSMNMMPTGRYTQHEYDAYRSVHTARICLQVGTHSMYMPTGGTNMCPVLYEAPVVM